MTNEGKQLVSAIGAMLIGIAVLLKQHRPNKC